MQTFVGGQGFRSALERVGLQRVGVLGRARYDAANPASLAMERVWPSARSVVVVGSGGRAHWDAFLAWVADDPRGRLLEREHPLDDFCAEAFAAMPLADCHVVFPTRRSREHLDFMRLARLAGLGAPSALGILASVEHGPWLALRAAVFTPEVLDETFERPSPCVGCDGPCRTACPPRLVAPEALTRPFPIVACVGARATTCGERCAAREACIVGQGSRYDELELRYHHDPTAARPLLLARFGLAAGGDARTATLTRA